MITIHRNTVARWRLGILGSVAFASPLVAAPIPGADTLQDLIDLGSTGVVIDGLRFYSFAYSASGSGGVPVPTAGEIAVADVGDLLPITSCGLAEGIRFSFGWSAFDGETLDTLFSYRVSVVDPSAYITLLGLQFNGLAQPPGTGTLTSVVETAQRSDGGIIVGSSTVALFSVYNDGVGGLTDVNAVCVEITPSTDLVLSKDIMLRADTVEDGGGIVTISWVDNAFVIVPEPSSIAIMASAAGYMIFRRRQSSRASAGE